MEFVKPTPEQIAERLAARAAETAARISETEQRAQAFVEREQRRAAMATKCDCGHLSNHPMNTAHGTACSDCYDRMSN